MDEARSLGAVDFIDGGAVSEIQREQRFETGCRGQCGEDALATIYYYDALRDLAELEEQITKHPEWCVATGSDARRE